MVKKGDTLIEVTLAIGIFSMIAIAVASVMSGGSASAQLALETTLTRQEIDAQADAIRFIHTAYTANKDNPGHPYTSLWRTITGKAIDIKDLGDNKVEEILQYTPSSCAELYDPSSPVLNNAFVVNTRQFNQLNENVGNIAGYSGKVVFPYKEGGTDNSSKFSTASTYPRLIYGTNTNNDNNAILADTTFPSNILRAEGIYVIAVRDPESTSIVDVIDEEKAKPTSAYYDFYIRTCWYGSRTDDPSTISTVIRLHDPDAIFAGGFFDIKFDKNTYQPDYKNNGEIKDKNNIRKIDLPVPEKYGWEFAGWCPSANFDVATGKCRGTTYKGNFFNPSNEHTVYDMKATWEHIKFEFRYDLSKGASDTIRQYNEQNPTTTICYLDEDNCRALTVNLNSIPPNPYKMGGRFSGWCLMGNVGDNGICTGDNSIIIDAGGRIDNTKLLEYSPDSPHVIILKATWAKWNESYKAVLTWGAEPRDLDSHVRGQKSNGAVIHTYYGRKTGSDVDPSIVLADLDRDVTWGYGPETMIFNTLGGLNYYYYVFCYNSYCTNVHDATVVMQRKGHNEANYSDYATFHSNDAIGTGRVWLIFANRNGKITFCNRRLDTNVNNLSGVDYFPEVADRYFNQYCPET